MTRRDYCSDGSRLVQRENALGLVGHFHTPSALQSPAFTAFLVSSQHGRSGSCGYFDDNSCELETVILVLVAGILGLCTGVQVCMRKVCSVCSTRTPNTG